MEPKNLAEHVKMVRESEPKFASYSERRNDRAFLTPNITVQRLLFMHVA